MQRLIISWLHMVLFQTEVLFKPLDANHIISTPAAELEGTTISRRPLGNLMHFQWLVLLRVVV